MQDVLNATGQKYEHTTKTTIEILKHFLYVALTLLGQRVALIHLLPLPVNLIPLTAEKLPPRGGPKLRK